MLIQTRPQNPQAAAQLQRDGLPPLLARLFAARGVTARGQLRESLQQLEPFATMKGILAAAARLADAIARQEKILVVADYDADGATGCAVMVTGLAALGAHVDWLVPNRFDDGYGLTPEVARQAAERQPDLLITVDNGIAAVEGVAEAQRLGMTVLVTDHHLPGNTLPDCLIVNPNQPGCPHPGKHLAGVGVAFYTLMALRAELRQHNAFATRPEPNLSELLDLVALGTVADVVRLDANNRLLVETGLKRIRSGRARPGIAALFLAAGRNPANASAQDLGFFIGPRLNASGRLADMGLGVACLLTRDADEASRLAAELERLNRERRTVEADMQREADGILNSVAVADSASLVLFDPGWHQGVIGLLASRLKERHHRPALIFAAADEERIKGSGRSIPGLHLRDALDRVDRLNPGLIVRFGGHAAAAGLTLRRDDFATFAAAFEGVARAWLTESDLTRSLETDGALGPHEFSLENACLLRDTVWGQGFPPPSFSGDFIVRSQRLVGDKHLKLHLATPEWESEAMLFNHDSPLPDRIHAVFRLDVNAWQGRQTSQLTLEYWA